MVRSLILQSRISIASTFNYKHARSIPTSILSSTWPSNMIVIPAKTDRPEQSTPN